MYIMATDSATVTRQIQQEEEEEEEEEEGKQSQREQIKEIDSDRVC